MSNRKGKNAHTKKRDKYKKGKLCPKCKKGHLQPCDHHYKRKYKDLVYCPVCVGSKK